LSNTKQQWSIIQPTTTVRIVVVGCIIDHCCLVFDKGEVRIVVVGCTIDHCCLVFDKGEVRVVVVGYIIDHCCLVFESIVQPATTTRTSPLSNTKQQWSIIQPTTTIRTSPLSNTTLLFGV
jgi:hypothetical protein